MPGSVDEAVQTAEQLERKAREEIPKFFRLEEAVGWLREALAIREAYQGEAHPDLIWTLHSGSTRWDGNTGRKVHLRPPAWASGAWRCGGRRSPVLRTSWHIRSES